MSGSGSGSLGRSSFWMAAVVAIDQLTKWYARASLAPGESVPVIPGLFSFTLVFNEGAAWGMLAGFRYGFIALAAAMLAIVAVRRERIFGPGLAGSVSAVLLCGGIAGNLVDRVVAGRVTDFIHVWHGNWHFPCFNVADSAITVGVALLFIMSLCQDSNSNDSPR